MIDYTLRLADEIVAGALIVCAVMSTLQVWVWINLWWGSRLAPTTSRGLWTRARFWARINEFCIACSLRSSDWGAVLGFGVILTVLFWSLYAYAR